MIVERPSRFVIARTEKRSPQARELEPRLYQRTDVSGKLENGSRIVARYNNEQPWDPLPGHDKVRCLRCEFWFSKPRGTDQFMCPDCEVDVQRGRRRK